MKCKFCLLTIESAPDICPARNLIPGELLPHEAETPGDRMIRDLARSIRTRSIYGRRKRR